jgi:hypothetical protein
VQRILQGTSDTLAITVTVAETGTDPTPDVATVTVTRADGTIVVAGATAQNGPAGTFVYPLVPAETATLDVLTAAWSFTLGGQVQTLKTQAEVVGGYHFSLPALRNISPFSGTTGMTTFPTTKLIEGRTYAEQVIEEACERAFVPRYWRGPMQDLRTWPFPDVRVVRSVVGPEGTVWGPADLSYYGTGVGLAPFVARRRGRWMVAVEHGMDSCPVDVSRASVLLARNYLIGAQATTSGGLDDRATSVTYADAGLTYSLVTGGVGGAETSIPEVNAVIVRYGPAVVA